MPEKEHRSSKKNAGLDLSPDEAREGARIAAKNARGLLDFAVTGAKCHNFGPAIALCVLASEEGAKALALFSSAVSPEESISLLEVFSRHKTKHNLSGISALMIHLGELMYRVKEEIQSEIDRGIEIEQRPGTRWVNRVIEELERLTRARGDQSTRFITWYHTADRLKMNGFYVDWTADKGWHNPSQLTEAELFEYRGYVEWWLDVVDFVLALPLDELREKMRELKLLTLPGPTQG
jgi:AbiV family abortive infection protein